MLHLKSENIRDKFNEYAKFVLREGYLFDDENKDSINACFEVFEKNEQGLFIAGNPGSGKTLFFEMMQKLVHPKGERTFLKVNVLDVVLQFNNKEIGHGVFRKWADKNVFFDDLGTESKGYLYGEKQEVFEKFIQIRYDLFRSKKVKTHFTTNLSKDEINARYGLRCASRLNEMCERVLLGNTSTYTDRRAYKNFIELPNVYHKPITSKEDEEWQKNYEAYKEKVKNEPPTPNNGGLINKLRESLGT